MYVFNYVFLHVCVYVFVCAFMYLFVQKNVFVNVGVVTLHKLDVLSSVCPYFLKISFFLFCQIVQECIVVDTTAWYFYYKSFFSELFYHTNSH